MSKQTINIGASPNDGTGTPLRTSFDYTNQNFTELYTAVGPSGNNIVVPGTATITGDLTVDTNVLKVDTTNNRVSINTTTFATDSVFAVKTTAGKFDVRAAGSLSVKLNSDQSMLYNVPTGNVHLFQINDADAMTLNSTGLGIGAAPTEKLSVNGSIGFQNAATQRWHITANSGSDLVFTRSSVADRLTITSDGNVGIGVTPSAWTTSNNVKALQFGGGSVYTYANDRFFIGQNVCITAASGDTYVNTAAASSYRQYQGIHSWFTAASGTAGNAITFTQAMTLDASGNLLVGKTIASLTPVGVIAQGNGATVSTLAGSTDATETSIVYSNGANAYRFYVGMAGTVYATNTTISAISDARFKENVQDIDVGLAAILSLKPRKFDWKAGKGKDIKGDRGFIAQEFETVFPNLIDEWKDPAPEGEAPYKSVRQDLIPVLVKAIQELAAEVNALKKA